MTAPESRRCVDIIKQAMAPERDSLTYNSLWWALVYAAQPTYRYAREGGVPPLPIEDQAEDAAIEAMIAAGVLVR